MASPKYLGRVKDQLGPPRQGSSEAKHARGVRAVDGDVKSVQDRRCHTHPDAGARHDRRPGHLLTALYVELTDRIIPRVGPGLARVGQAAGGQ
jgi:hypothetical protein